MISIYKIVDNTNGNIYVGSTQQLLKYRKKQHESKYNPCRSREIIKNNDYYFELIEECEEDKRNEREQYWIDKYDCVNKKETYNARKWGKKEENKLKTRKLGRGATDGTLGAKQNLRALRAARAHGPKYTPLVKAP